MSQPVLLIIINNSTEEFHFENTECSEDNRKIIKGINFTSGKNGKGCDIPICNEERYFVENRMYLGNINRAIFICYNEVKKKIFLNHWNGPEVDVNDNKKCIIISKEGEFSFADINDQKLVK